MSDRCENRLSDLIERIVGSDDDVWLLSGETGRQLRGKVKRRAGNRVIIYSKNDRYGYKAGTLAEFDGSAWCVVDEAFDQSGESTRKDIIESLLSR